MTSVSAFASARNLTTTSRWRWFAIGLWITVAVMAFMMIGSTANRSWLLLILIGVIPPAMLLWLWNEDGPSLLGTLRTGKDR